MRRLERRAWQAIQAELNAIEQEKCVRVLLAVESGSRAWGFDSPDSDYDVRFLYVRTWESYLRLERARDVIEWKLDDVLDINGWDFDKTLRLLHTSNPTLFEWLSSPIVYRRDPFAERLTELAQSYFLSRTGMYHYLHMAEGNNCDFLKGAHVKLKKYFYVLRPILACRHILAEGTPPPMRFDTLVEQYAERNVKQYIGELLAMKKAAPEIGEGPRVQVLNDYIETSLAELKAAVKALPLVRKRDWEDLNALFLLAMERFAKKEIWSAPNDGSRCLYLHP